MKSLVIRNVPDDVYRRLEARAVLEGRSLSEFALVQLVRTLERPTRREVIERVREREAVASVSSAELVRAERDSH